MSRTKREAQLKAIYGPKYGAVVITQLGGRKRDKRKMLEEQLPSYAEGSLPGETRVEAGLEIPVEPAKRKEFFDELKRSDPKTYARWKRWGKAQMRNAGLGPDPKHPWGKAASNRELGLFGGMKNVVGGVDALLEPLFGLIQNDPEGQEMLRSVGLGFLAPKETYKSGSLPEYQEGSLSGEDAVPAYARSPIIAASRSDYPIHRKVMNAIPTLAGLGMGLMRGATFGPGPNRTIVAQYPDESGTVDPQTLGEVMLLPEGRTGEAVPTHELGHVTQGRYAGPFLPAAAALTSGALSLMGRDPYLESPFETSALEMGQAEKRGESTTPAMLQAFRRAILGPEPE